MSDPKSLNPREEINLLLNVAQSINSAANIEEILADVLDQIIATISAEKGFVILEKPPAIEFVAARGIKKTEIENPEYETSMGVVRECLKTKQVILSSNASTDERFSTNESVINLKLKSVLCAPIISSSGTKGAVYVENRMSAGAFSKDHISVISSIAQNAGTAIDYAELIQKSKGAKQLQNEFDSARMVQKDLIQRKQEASDKWVFSGEWAPAKEVAGDFYFVAERGDGKLVAVIADISGKGASAAIFMTTVRDQLRSHINEIESPAEILSVSNSNLAMDNPQSMFASVFLAIIDEEFGTMIYSNGGHNPAFLLKNGKIQKLDAFHGPVLGAMENSVYSERKIKIKTDSLLFMYTDGLIEAENSQGEYYGYQRAEDFLIANSHAPPRTLTRRMLAHVLAFQAEGKQVDDITLLALSIPKTKQREDSTATLLIEANLEGLNQALSFASQFIIENKISINIGRETEIVIDELLSNAIKFGEDDIQSKGIELSLSILKGHLKLTIKYGGKEFNPFALRSEIQPGHVSDRFLGGVGLNLIKELSDHREYSRLNDMNLLVLKWILSSN